MRAREREIYSGFAPTSRIGSDEIGTCRCRANQTGFENQENRTRGCVDVPHGMIQAVGPLFVDVHQFPPLKD